MYRFHGYASHCVENNNGEYKWRNSKKDLEKAKQWISNQTSTVRPIAKRTSILRNSEQTLRPLGKWATFDEVSSVSKFAQQQ